MNNKILSIIFAFVTIVISGCTNNGDIGYLYGEWAMDSFTIDGENADIDLEVYYWKFQGNIIQISEVLPYNESLNYIGTWQKDGNQLSLNFTYSQTDGNLFPYTPPAELGIPGQTITVMTIDKETDKTLIFGFVNDAGLKIQYSLRKLK